MITLVLTEYNTLLGRKMTNYKTTETIANALGGLMANYPFIRAITNQEEVLKPDYERKKNSIAAAKQKREISLLAAKRCRRVALQAAERRRKDFSAAASKRRRRIFLRTEHKAKEKFLAAKQRADEKFSAAKQRAEEEFLAAKQREEERTLEVLETLIASNKNSAEPYLINAFYPHGRIFNGTCLDAARDASCGIAIYKLLLENGATCTEDHFRDALHERLDEDIIECFVKHHGVTWPWEPREYCDTFYHCLIRSRDPALFKDEGAHAKKIVALLRNVERVYVNDRDEYDLTPLDHVFPFTTYGEEYAEEYINSEEVSSGSALARNWYSKPDLVQEVADALYEALVRAGAKDDYGVFTDTN